MCTNTPYYDVSCKKSLGCHGGFLRFLDLVFVEIESQAALCKRRAGFCANENAIIGTGRAAAELSFVFVVAGGH